MQLTLTEVKRYSKDKFGKEFKNSRGAYQKVLIKAQEYGDRWMSGFGDKTNAGWNPGMVVEAEVSETEATGPTGQPYLNFKTPRTGGSFGNLQSVMDLLKSVALDVSFIKGLLESRTKKSVPVEPPAPQEPPEDEINIDQIPF